MEETRGTVREWMSEPIATVETTTLVDEALRHMEAHDIEHLVVVAHGRMQGVVGARELEDAPPDVPVYAFMISPPLVVLDGATIEHAAALLDESGAGCLPVVSGRGVVGILTRSDLRRAGVLVDDERCAACGATRHLEKVEEIVYCRVCLAQARTPLTDDDLEEVGAAD